MSLRRQLPVSSPIDPRALARALARVLASQTSRRATRDTHAAVAETLQRRFGAGRVALTDSGTSALVMALRLAVPPDGVVAFPGYACIDLAAAARFAGVRVTLYDLDPATLSPDLSSLDAALARGASAVLAVHLYGYAADIGAMRQLTTSRGAVLIEDAAQGAGGTLHGDSLGALGDLSILSFGRGKGTTGGSGGALLSLSPHWNERVESVAADWRTAPAGWRDLASAAAQWALGRPSLYAIPSSLPGLQLGEMVYHPAREPGGLSLAAATLVERALELDNAEVAARRVNAAAVAAAVRWDASLVAVRPVPGSVPGYLRVPVLDRAGRGQCPALGAMRGYPLTLLEQPELSPCLMGAEPPTPGAHELRTRLLTLPVHSMVTRDDISALSTWLHGPARNRPATLPEHAA